MSKTQDVFGAAPKSVLNKPYMQVLYTEPSGTSGSSASGIGWTDRALNKITVNEIPGASLVGGEIVLPAGEYWIEGDAHIYFARQHLVALKNAANDAIIVRSSNSYYNADISTPQQMQGRVVLTGPMTLKLSGYVGQAVTGNWGIHNGLGEEQYAQIDIWKLDSNVETPVISDPTMTLARPLMHVQDQKPSGTNGGTSAIGANARDLNTVLTNDIPGASLAGNQITLPAGEYYIEANAPATYTGATRARVDLDGSPVLYGSSNVAAVSDSGSGHSCPVSGRVTLSATGVIEIVTEATAVRASTGLGVPVSQGTPEVYTNIRIWQLDAVNKQPVLVNDKLYPLPGNVIVTGNMHGLEYEYTAPNEITVQAGICMDSVNETVLQLTNPQLVTIPSGVSTVYNLFLTDDGQLVKTDTDVDGANLPAQDKRRWIGYVLTDATGNVEYFEISGNMMEFGNSPIVSACSSAITRYLTRNPAVMPPSRVESVFLVAYHRSNYAIGHIYKDNNGARGRGVTYSPLSAPDGEGVEIVGDYFWAQGDNNTGVRMHYVRMKR